jgi:ornithine--oxo-acid transaminase
MASSPLAQSPSDGTRLYEKYVNPQWVRLLDVLQMNVRYRRCVGTELHTEDGRLILDFNSGYCVHNAGHNHPRIKAEIIAELERDGAAMLQTGVPELAGILGSQLCERAGGRLTKAFFASSGSEGVEAAIKFSRAHTGRVAMLSAKGSFHGLTCGALSLMSDTFWKDGFGPMLPDVEMVSFGALNELATKLSSKRFAAFIVEPVQVEAGMRIPDGEYLKQAEALCRRYGTLFVLDEVQTGLHRTGPFLAAHHFAVDPDIIILAKALSGGLIPVGAVLMTDAVYNSTYSTFKRSIVHTSTYGENALAMRAGLATLEVLETERLGERATRLGRQLRYMLAARLEDYEMIGEIRGIGMLTAIEFRAPKRLRLRIPFEAFARIHPAMFGQVLVMHLFHDRGFLTQICGNNFMVLKVAPPLTVTEDQLEQFVAAIGDIVELMHSGGRFWWEALGMASRLVGAI